MEQQKESSGTRWFQEEQEEQDLAPLVQERYPQTGIHPAEPLRWSQAGVLGV